ncbi:sulfhydryl oxidase 1 [Caerostris extrusa]|uniref:Sulfhydryl oxidase n=1 Tax=Caerostris extrusa TaxID=172846 RepID=A0AAV4U7C4_CAEEX|nr:sulfhydryl oxidase 1 [Caerostris extrusa]
MTKCTQYLLYALVLVFVFSPSLALNSRVSSLYSEDDPLSELNSTLFNKRVLGSSKVWIIEFYNNWCGHCIRYAPTWKQFAREITTWKRIVDIAVVNCNDAQNVKLCRFYEVESFPTIKMFWLNTLPNDTGTIINGNRDIISLENHVVDFLETNWNKGVPSDWPVFKAIQMENLADITEAMPDRKQSVMLFVEFPDYHVGRKVILDISFQISVSVSRILTTSEKLMTDLDIEVSNTTVPLLTRVYRNNFQMPLLKFTRYDNDSYIRDQIFKFLVGIPRSGGKKIEDFLPDEQLKNNISNINAAYMIDLENAVYNSLSKEIGVVKLIEGEKLKALTNYLHVLEKYFPGNPYMMKYLTNFYNWVASKAAISGEEFVEAMQAKQNKKHYLHPMRPWVGCQGSEPKYRGYPCSLWMLFHTLTVQADKKSKEMMNGPKGKDVLFIIRDYVKYFFTCEECSKNFLKMAHNLETEVGNSQEAVLWLWEGHNKVNNRLSGDVTEDPQYPKVQFPSVEDCPKCVLRIDNEANEIIWDKPVVLEFLHNFYDKKNILSYSERKTHRSLINDQINAANTAMGIKFILFLTSAPLLLSTLTFTRL